MARPRSASSKLSYSGLGLDPDEDKKLIRLLDEHDYTAKKLIRFLIRKWMKAKEDEAEREKNLRR